MCDRERVGELARTSGLGMLPSEHPFWGKVLALAGQEIHAAVSRALGVGAPNSVDTTVAAAKERVRIPRPKRETATVRVVPCNDVARVLSQAAAPLSASQIADRCGVGLPRDTSVDMRSLAVSLADLVKLGEVEVTGARRGKRYAAVPVEPSDGDVA